MKLKFSYAIIMLWAVIGSLVTGISSAQVTAQFTAFPKTGCEPLFVSFINNSTGTGTLTYTWDFGNGNSSNLQSPSQTYNTCGDYVITLTVSNGTSTSTDTAHITVYCKPTSNFTYDISNGCPGTCVNFSNTSVAGSGTLVNTFWDFGDGNTSTSANPTHCYSSPGNFNVTLTVTNSFGCTNSKVITNAITINTPPNAGFSGIPVTQCFVPATVNFTNSSTGTANLSYNWNFGDPSSGASDSSTLANPSHIYNAFGSYTVTLIVTDGNGCKDTVSLPNYINLGSFLTTITTVPGNTGCCPFVVNFGEVTQGSPTGYTWVFGGGIANSTSKNPVITFPCPAGNNPDTYHVTLTETFAGGCTAIDSTIIVVSNKPVTSFTSTSNLNICAPPASVTFNNTSTGPVGTTYQWFFGDNSVSTAVNPSHTYTGCGSYTVMLIATNSLGCSDTVIQPGYVNIICPFATFTATPTGGCVPQIISFNSTASTGNPTTWSWNFGDPGSGAANVSNLQDPTHTYTLPGCYTVTLKTTNALGCVDSVVMPNAVCLGQPAIPNFSATPRTTCALNPIYFTNLSSDTNSLSKFYWGFGDTTSSNAINPSHIYNDTGYLNVTLIVCNSGCCDTLTLVDYIHILPPIAAIDVIKDCNHPDSVCFDGSKSIGADSYDWNFGDPGSGSLDSSVLIAPCHYYSASGDYTVSLTVYNDSTQCSFTHTTIIHVRNVKAAFTLLPTKGCLPLSVVSLNTSTDAISYKWTVTDSSGKVLDKNTAFSPAYFDFPSVGTYNFELIAIDINGCSDTLTKSLFLDSSFIIANFVGAPITGCAPLITQFTDSSTSTGGPITSWLWNFGDLNNSSSLDTSTLQNPEHTYTKTGDYSVSLIVTDSLGCTQELIRSNYIIVKTPGTDFTAPATNGCVGNPICFTNLTTGNGYTYSWNFGDTASGANDSSSLADPCHAYTATGVYTVSLKITSSGGCDSTLIKNNFITISGPTANFGASGPTFTICPPLLVNFVDSSHSNIVSWLWNFGDGNTSTNQNPSHVYSISGSYTVTLIVTNSSGCTDTLVKTAYVQVQGPNGTFTFTPDQGCSPLDVCFKATTSTTSNLTYIWNYGNTTSGPIPGGDSICFIYTTPGIYHPSLILQDSAGCIFSVNSPDSVWVRGPETKFVVENNPRCGPGPMLFIDSTTSEVKIKSWYWNFGDVLSGLADTSTLQDPTHVFANVGQYVVTLLVTTIDGCVAPYQDTISILSKPIAIINTINNPVCLGGVMFFRDSSTSVFKLVSWKWNFGDTSSGVLDTSFLEDPSHQYTAAGNYAVKLMITDSIGCVDSITNMVTVNPLPVVNAGPNVKICTGNSTILDASGGVQYLWSPQGNLSNDSIYNPIANPTVTTTYSVLATDINGCKNSDSVIIIVNPLPIDSVSSLQKICSGLSTTLFVKGGVSYLWSPGSGLSNDTLNIPVANPKVTTVYSVVVTDSNGCKSSDSVKVIVNPLPPANAGPNQKICIDGSTKLEGSGGINYSWTSNPSGFSSDSSSPVVSPTITTQYFVMVKDTNGCIAGDSTSIVVNPLPVIAVNGGSVCNGLSTTITASGGIDYLWTPSTGLSNNTIDDPVADPTTTTTYTVLVTDINGCQNTDSLKVTVDPLPIVVVSATQKICLGLSATLSASGGVQYGWSPNTGLSNDTLKDPIANPTVTTNYIVLVTDTNGCKNKDSVLITVNPLPPANAGPDQNICIGATTTLNGSGGLTYAWNSNPPGFTSTSNSPTVSPTITTEYVLMVTDTNGCVANDSTTVFVHPLPTVKISNNVSICLGSSVQLNASGGNTYVWSPAIGLSNSTISNPIANPIDTTKYLVTTTDVFGCISKDSVTVDVMFPFVASFGNGDTICSGNSVQLIASGGKVYAWSPSNTLNNANISDPVASPTVSTLYTVTISDSVCFTDTGYVNVYVYPNPGFNAGQNQNILLGQSVVLGQLNPPFTGTFTWTPQSTLSCNNCQNPTATPDTTTLYIVTLVNQYGCITSDSVIITVKIICAEDLLFVPNAFTPNGDGLDDIFYVRARGIHELNYFRVFDRWGELLFETKDLSTGWDGTFKGKKLPPAVYVYDVSVVCSSGEILTKKGNVTLIR